MAKAVSGGMRSTGKGGVADLGAQVTREMIVEAARRGLKKLRIELVRMSSTIITEDVAKAIKQYNPYGKKWDARKSERDKKAGNDGLYQIAKNLRQQPRIIHLVTGRWIRGFAGEDKVEAEIQGKRVVATLYNDAQTDTGGWYLAHIFRHGSTIRDGGMITRWAEWVDKRADQYVRAELDTLMGAMQG